MDLISRLRTGALLGLRDATAFTPAPAGVEDQDQTQDGQQKSDHPALREESGDERRKWRREENREWLNMDQTDVSSTMLKCTDEHLQPKFQLNSIQFYLYSALYNKNCVLNPSHPSVIISPSVPTGNPDTSVPVSYLTAKYSRTHFKGAVHKWTQFL